MTAVVFTSEELMKLMTDLLNNNIVRYVLKLTFFVHVYCQVSANKNHSLVVKNMEVGLAHRTLVLCKNGMEPSY